MEDVEPFLALAREAFDNEPDAVNLWIGDDRSMSAVHKDHYEVCGRTTKEGHGRWRAPHSAGYTEQAPGASTLLNLVSWQSRRRRAGSLRGS